jgi:[Skp1-protein]-hydroxyproline N-acetylglucosaminyltransferase
VLQLPPSHPLHERPHTTNPPPPCRYDGRGPSVTLPSTAQPTVLCAGEFGDDGLLRIIGRRVTATAFPCDGDGGGGGGGEAEAGGRGGGEASDALPVASLFWAAGYSFSRSALLSEVPYNARLPSLFLGEELDMLARMWTRGWDVFAPPEAVVFHMWERSQREHTFTPDAELREASR